MADAAAPHASAQHIGDSQTRAGCARSVSRTSPLRPEEVTPYSNRKAWWQCSEGHEWQTSIAIRARGCRCPQCLLHGTSAQQIRLAAELTALGLPVSARHKPIEVTGRRPVRGDVVLADWRVVIEFDGEFWHIDSVVRDQVQTEALLEAGWHVLRLREGNLPKLGVGEMSVSVPIYADAHTLACAALDGLARFGCDVPDYEGYRVAGQAIATVQADADIYSLRNVNLAAEFPGVAAEWHPTKNTTTPDRVAPFSNKKAWWICAACGHEWQADIHNRTNNGHGCSVCGRKRTDTARTIPKRGRSLADRFPEVATIWHPTRNGGLTPADVHPGSNTHRWWLCPRCDKDFLCTPHNRKKSPLMCPTCSFRQAWNQRKARAALVQPVDDLDGTMSDDITTVPFSLDGVAYEIDLSASNADRLRDGLADYVAGARRTSGRGRRGTRPHREIVGQPKAKLR